MALTLEQVHAVEAKGFDLNDGIADLRLGFGDVVIDEEGACGACASLDV